MTSVQTLSTLVERQWLSNSGSNDISLTDTNALDLGTVGVGNSGSNDYP